MDIKEFTKKGGQASAAKRFAGLNKQEISARMSAVRRKTMDTIKIEKFLYGEDETPVRISWLQNGDKYGAKVEINRNGTWEIFKKSPMDIYDNSAKVEQFDNLE